MTAWLIKRFVRNPERTADPGVRAAYGTLASAAGMIVNLLLAAAKFLMGLLSGSLAITADAANNLSDAAGSLVTFITVRLAAKPVDPEHPFGHGRMEYLGSLAVGMLILAMGFGLLRDGIGAILQPAAPAVSWLVMIILVLSILSKCWLYLFYRNLGGKTGNGTLLAASKDSLSDVFSTGAVLASLLLHLFFGWKLDGWMGLLVSLLVFKAGFEVCKTTVDSLLGGKPDPELIHQIRELLLAREGILGLHDLVVHDYGPGRCFASVHAEVPADGDLLAIHEMIDDAEQEIARELNIPVCIHMDPVVSDDDEAGRISAALNTFLQGMNKDLRLHDLRRVPGENQINLIFDVAVPPDYRETEMLRKALESTARMLDDRHRCVIHFDVDYFCG